MNPSPVPTPLTETEARVPAIGNEHGYYTPDSDAGPMKFGTGIYFDAPRRYRPATPYGAPAWSTQGNVIAFDPSKINDGNRTLPAARIENVEDNVQGIVLSPGSPKRFGKVTVSGKLLDTQRMLTCVFYSDVSARGPWTQPGSCYVNNPSTVCFEREFADTGSHPHWLVQFSGNGGGGESVLAEIQFYEIDVDRTDIREYRLLRVDDSNSTTTQSLLTIPAAKRPTPSNPIDMAEFESLSLLELTLLRRDLCFAVVTVTTDGVASDSSCRFFSYAWKPFTLRLAGLPVFPNNAAAIGGGFKPGEFYRNGADPDIVCVVH